MRFVIISEQLEVAFLFYYFNVKKLASISLQYLNPEPEGLMVSKIYRKLDSKHNHPKTPIEKDV